MKKAKTKPKKRAPRARLSAEARLARIERVRLLKIEKLAGEPDKHVLHAELVVAGLPDPPAQPLPSEPIDLADCPDVEAKSDWLCWIRWLWN